MIMDELLEFADATALSTAGTGLAAVGDVIDLGATPQDLGNGQPLYLVIQVDTAITSVAVPASSRRTASSTAISSNGFMDILTLAVSTPVWSALTRTLTL